MMRGAFRLWRSRKKRGYAGSREETQGLKLQKALRDLLNAPSLKTTVSDRKVFEGHSRRRAKESRTSSNSRHGQERAVLNALSERDETAAVCRSRNGEPEPDPDLRGHRARAPY